MDGLGGRYWGQPVEPGTVVVGAAPIGDAGQTGKLVAGTPAVGDVVAVPAGTVD